MLQADIAISWIYPHDSQSRIPLDIDKIVHRMCMCERIRIYRCLCEVLSEPSVKESTTEAICSYCQCDTVLPESPSAPADDAANRVDPMTWRLQMVTDMEEKHWASNDAWMYVFGPNSFRSHVYMYCLTLFCAPSCKLTSCSLIWHKYSTQWSSSM